MPTCVPFNAIGPKIYVLRDVADEINYTKAENRSKGFDCKLPLCFQVADETEDLFNDIKQLCKTYVNDHWRNRESGSTQNTTTPQPAKCPFGELSNRIKSVESKDLNRLASMHIKCFYNMLLPTQVGYGTVRLCGRC